MPSYLITGVNRGLGLTFLRKLSENKDNLVIGTARDKKAALETVEKTMGVRDNVVLVQCDLTDYDSLKNAVPEVENATGGELDYLIANAAYLSPTTSYDTFTTLGEKPQFLEDEMMACFRTNVLGNVYLFNLFMPLILRGAAKKVITLTTGYTDDDLTTGWDIMASGPYTASKSAMNTVVAKYSAEYREKGVLFLALAPGSVVGHSEPPKYTKEQTALMMDTFAKFSKYASHFKRQITADESIDMMLDVIGRASIETGYAGKAVSQFGNRQWL